MSSVNINRVVLTGNLTADPELRTLPSGTSVCKLRVARNTRRKDGASGDWVDKPNYFDVTVWGAQGENVARYNTKGSALAAISPLGSLRPMILPRRTFQASR
jgi:single-strand DNA-binding protein